MGQIPGIFMAMNVGQSWENYFVMYGDLLGYLWDITVIDMNGISMR